MYWGWWLCQFPLPIAAGWAFRALAARRRGVAVAAAAPLLVLGIACAVRYVPEEIEAAFFPPWPYVFFQQAWTPVGVFAFLGALSPWLGTSAVRRPALLLAGFALVLHGYDSSWMLESAPDAALTTRFDPDGVCLQSTDYSCGAAAAVMLARRAGVAATEAEMARRGWTSELKGTRLLGVLQALAAALPDRRVRLRRLTFEELRALGAPAIVELRLRLFLTHKVVVTRVTDTYVYLDDPLSGKGQESVEWFRSKWCGYTITVD
ncbi:MAG: hypothetical protein HZA54_08400 [Planctomycetes bacterium]|nr:hypothetical protein [Planctomycetota bacterium]